MTRVSSVRLSIMVSSPLYSSFFKQKTAYEIYQCDWSSDVCSYDLLEDTFPRHHLFRLQRRDADHADGAMALGDPGLLGADMRALLAGSSLRKAAQHDHYLSLHVEAAVVVDAETLDLDSITGEHQRRGDLVVGLARIHPHQHIFLVVETLLA